MVGGELCGASVSWNAMQSSHPGGVVKRKTKRMFASATADNDDRCSIHGVLGCSALNNPFVGPPWVGNAEECLCATKI